MKKIYCVAIIALASLQAIHAQDKNISGLWEGKLNVGIDLRVVFHFTKNADGSYTASLDSPDQNANGIPIQSVTVKADSVIADIALIKGSYKAVLINDSSLSGKWFQGPGSFPLQLKKVLAVTVVKHNRPQTPAPPFSYTSEEVEYDNAGKTIHFGATLSYPSTGGPFATALLITGSGQQDRDETIFNHKPFAVIADYLAKKGYAVLRVDDRGVGKTTGQVKTATSADFAKDVEAGLAYLKSRKEVAKNKLGLVGHSEGGMIAPLVAARNKDIAFIILLAGPGIKGDDLLAKQNKAILTADGISADAAGSYEVLFKQLVDISLQTPDTTKAIAEGRKAYINWKARTPAAQLNALGFTSDEDARKIVAELAKTASSPWMNYFLSYDPAPALKKTTAKILALNGSKDIQVIAGPNLAGIQKALTQAGNKHFTIKELDGLNHLFQHCHTCTVNEYNDLEETFSPEALDIIGVWLDKNIQP